MRPRYLRSLDASAVHPESYPVEKIAASCQRPLRSLIGDSAFLRSVKAADFVTETVGLPTVTDILRELDKPGRDPRPEFKTARLQEGVEKITDLQLEKCCAIFLLLAELSQDRSRLRH